MKATFKHMGIYDLEFTDADVVEPRDFIPAGEYNPHKVRPWYVHDAGYCVGVTFASCEQDALDILADAGKLDRFQVADENLADYGEEEEGLTRCGNASEPFDLGAYMGMFPLPVPAFSFAAMFMAAQAEADQTAQTHQTTTDAREYHMNLYANDNIDPVCTLVVRARTQEEADQTARKQAAEAYGGKAEDYTTEDATPPQTVGA